MADQSTGQLVEQLYRNARPGSLTRAQRARIIAFACGFEECHYSREQLKAADDNLLVSAAYWAMSDYAKGQQ